jgi:hypothetical protein
MGQPLLNRMDVSMAENKTTTISDPEWQNRVLCSDESCIGVIGPDGRCKECGKPYEGELPANFSDPASESDGESRTDNAAGDLDPDEPAAVSNADDSDDHDDAPAEDDWAQRILCSDESCIGVIGPDGKCKECGKPYTG